jgi:tetratricopeptide (TPR) repeat protein
MFGVAGCGGSALPPESPEPGTSDSAGGEEGGEVLEASSDDVRRGMDAIQSGDFNTAKEVLAKAHSDNPQDPQAAFYLGVAEEGLGNKEAAMALYQKALELDPKLTEASVNLSALEFEAGNVDAALKTIEAALKGAPKHAGLLTNHALALEAKGDKEQALSAYAKAVDASPDNTKLRFAYAELLAKSDKRDAALGQLETIVKSEDAEVLAAAGGLLGQLKAWDVCVRALSRAIDKKSTAELLWRRGLCHHGTGDRTKEQADYEAALKDDPKSAAANYYLGMLFKAANEKKKALLHLEAAAKLAEEPGLRDRAKAAIQQVKKSK